MLVTAAHLREHPFSRSYGVNLPSSLTIVLSNTLVSSTCLPVSVCGTVRIALSLEDFLDDPHPSTSLPVGADWGLRSVMPADLPTGRDLRHTRTTNSRA